MEKAKSQIEVDGKILPGTRFTRKWNGRINAYNTEAALGGDNKKGIKKYPIVAPSIYGVIDLVGNVHEFTTEDVNGAKTFVIKGGSLRTRLLFSNCEYSSHSNGDSGNEISFRYVMPINKK